MNRGFVSYSHNDNRYFKYLVNGLKMHSTCFENCDWQLWDDSHLPLGSNWHSEIQKRIVECEFALLLISADFFNSEYIKKNELKTFLKLVNDKGFRIYPILIRDVDISQITNISKHQFFVARGEDYGILRKKEQLISYSELFRYDNDGVLIPNPYIDTYHKNLVNAISNGLSTEHRYNAKSSKGKEKDSEYSDEKSKKSEITASTIQILNYCASKKLVDKTPEAPSSQNRDAFVNDEKHSSLPKKNTSKRYRRIAPLLIVAAIVSVITLLFSFYIYWSDKIYISNRYLQKADYLFNINHFVTAIEYYKKASSVYSNEKSITQISLCKKHLVLAKHQISEADSLIKKNDFKNAYILYDSAFHNNPEDPFLINYNFKKDSLSKFHKNLYFLNKEKLVAFNSKTKYGTWWYNKYYDGSIALFDLSRNAQYGMSIIDFINDFLGKKVFYDYFALYGEAKPFDISSITKISGLPIYNPNKSQSKNIKEGFYYQGSGGDDFKYYNPELINWITDNLIPNPESPQGNGIAYKMLYNFYFKDVLRNYTKSYTILFQDGINHFNTLKNEYIKDSNWYSWEREYGVEYNYHYSSFWLRRGVDETIDECWRGLSKIMNLYDNEWFSEQIKTLKK